MKEIIIERAESTDIGNVRTANEDSLGFIETGNLSVFTVCDGMGGHVGGATASKMAVDNVLYSINNANSGNLSVDINNAIVFANQAILDAALNNPQLKGMGTTCTVLLVDKFGIYIGHVGDSRIYLLSNKKLYRLTKDHSFVQNLVDSGIISDLDAESHPRKNELTSALGIKQNITPTVNHTPIHPKAGDVFLLCSDGLCGLVKDDSIERILNTNSNIDQAVGVLIEAANNAGGTDNITAQLIKIKESPYLESSFVDFSPKEDLQKTFVSNTPKEVYNKKTPIWKNRKVTSVIAGSLLIIIILFNMPNFSGGETQKPEENLEEVSNTSKSEGSDETTFNTETNNKPEENSEGVSDKKEKKVTESPKKKSDNKTASNTKDKKGNDSLKDNQKKNQANNTSKSEGSDETTFNAETNNKPEENSEGVSDKKEKKVTESPKKKSDNKTASNTKDKKGNDSLKDNQKKNQAN